ncbi:hypothetical protein D3C86_1521640 [compost metagenome]
MQRPGRARHQQHRFDLRVLLVPVALAGRLGPGTLDLHLEGDPALHQEIWAAVLVQAVLPFCIDASGHQQVGDGLLQFGLAAIAEGMALEQVVQILQALNG